MRTTRPPRTACRCCSGSAPRWRKGTMRLYAQPIVDLAHGQSRPATSCSSGSATGWSPRCPRPTSCPRRSAPTSCSSSTAGCCERAVQALANTAGAGGGPAAGGQRLGALAGEPRSRAVDPRAAQGGRGGAGAARPGDHRDHRDQEPRRGAPPRDAAHRGGLRLRARRLRRRVRLVLLPQVPPVHHGQDRGRVRPPGRRPRRRPRARRRRSSAWPTSSACARWPSRWTGPRW